MKMKKMLSITASVVMASAVLAQTNVDMTMKKAPKAAATAPTFIPAADLKWVDLDPKGAPGVKVVDLWGNHAKGAYGAYLKLPAGFTTPLHTHTYAMKVAFISGTYIQAPEGKPEVRLGPGSYMMQPGGNYKHVTSCDKSADCVLFVVSSGAFDLKPVQK